MAMATAARVMFWFPGDGAVTRFAASLVCAVLYNTAAAIKEQVIWHSGFNIHPAHASRRESPSRYTTLGTLDVSILSEDRVYRGLSREIGCCARRSTTRRYISGQRPVALRAGTPSSSAAGVGLGLIDTTCRCTHGWTQGWID